MIILGIDPGTSRIGFAVLKKSRTKLTSLEYGCWDIAKKTQYQRLNIIFNNLKKLIDKYKPDLFIVEKLFFFKNMKTAMTVSEARGVILLAAQKKKLNILELTPLEVKQYLMGYGRSEKPQIQKFVMMYLDLKSIPKPDDAADALAICLAGIAKISKKGAENK